MSVSPGPVARCALVLYASLLAGPSTGAGEKLILDVDPLGDYDDLTALWTAAVSPELDLLGVVVTGAGGDASVRAAGKALRLVGRDDVPVVVGRTPEAPLPPFSYWSQFPARKWGLTPKLERFADGYEFEPAGRDGAGFYLDTVSRHPGEVTLVVAGALTTLAEAMDRAEAEDQPFLGGIKQVLFGGGDFDTSEYNVYIDVPSAKKVFTSGVVLYQFGGEGEGKAYLRHADRERLWAAETPLTWAMQDLYRAYRAGWDPTAPYIPILYDVHPVALLIEGQRISRFEPAAVEVAPDGRLRRIDGEPNLFVRVENRGELLVDLVVERMTARRPPAENHVRAIVSRNEWDDGIAASAEGLLESIRSEAPSEELERKLAVVEAHLAGAGGDRDARWHLAMARGYLLGEPRPGAWNDLYTERFVPLVLLWDRLPKRPIATWTAVLLLLSASLLVWRRLRVQRRAA